MYRFISNLLLSFFLVVSSLSSVLANEHSIDITPQEYIEYLTEKGKTDPEALKGRQQFESLSNESQQKFINYMSDSKIMEEIFNSPVPENSKKVLHNGDVILEHKTETELLSETEVVNETKEDKVLPAIAALFYGSCFAAPKAPPIKTFKLTDVRTINLLGLQTKYTVWVLYTAQGNKVKAIKGGNGYYSNSVPISITKESVSKYIHGNKAQTCVVWKHSPFGWDKVFLDFACYCGHHDVIGNHLGVKSYRFYKD